MKKDELRTELKAFAKNLVDGYVDDTTILELLGTDDVINDYVDNQLKERWIKLPTDNATAILPDVSGWRLLKLSLKKKPFDVMITGEKPIEFRKDTKSKWIRSRLLTENGDKREYDGVLFTNGYGNDKPYFIARYRGFTLALQDFEKEYSNGLTVDVEEGDFQIYLGEIIAKGNVNA